MNENKIQQIIHYAKYIISLCGWCVDILSTFPRFENFEKDNSPGLGVVSKAQRIQREGNKNDSSSKPDGIGEFHKHSKHEVQ